MAAFLSSDYSAVIFTATCDAKAREVVLRYFPPPGLPKEGWAQAVLRVGDVPLTTNYDSQAIEGRSRLSPRLIAALTRPGELTIDAPNDMDEPWYVGEAASFRALALACKN